MIGTEKSMIIINSFQQIPLCNYWIFIFLSLLHLSVCHWKFYRDRHDESNKRWLASKVSIIADRSNDYWLIQALQIDKKCWVWLPLSYYIENDSIAKILIYRGLLSQTARAHSNNISHSDAIAVHLRCTHTMAHILSHYKTWLRCTFCHSTTLRTLCCHWETFCKDMRFLTLRSEYCRKSIILKIVLLICSVNYM